MADLRVAIDIGGTGARILVFSADNRFLKEKRLDATANLLLETKKVIRELRLKNPQIMVGSRGVWTSHEKAALRKKFSGLSKNISAMSDIELAHHLAFGPHAGIVLNAGTGSIAFGRSSTGKTARAGGLGPLLGDEGSGFWIGKEWLKQSKAWPALRTLALQKEATRLIASFASRALTGRGNVAKSILLRAQEHLEQLVIEVNSALNLQKKAPVSLTGGLFNNKRFDLSFRARLKKSGFSVIARSSRHV